VLLTILMQPMVALDLALFASRRPWLRLVQLIDEAVVRTIAVRAFRVSLCAFVLSFPRHADSGEGRITGAQRRGQLLPSGERCR
jgi:hypothetical protein